MKLIISGSILIKVHFSNIFFPNHNSKFTSLCASLPKTKYEIIQELQLLFMTDIIVYKVETLLLYI